MYLSSMDLQRPDVPAKDMGATPSVYLTTHQREVFGHVPIGAAGTELGCSTWTRTRDQEINSLLLYQLSY
jgi:hypothetical protein